jgi:hypothetical protein
MSAHPNRKVVPSPLFTVVHKKWPMHKICPTSVDRPDNNSTNILKFSPSNSIHIGPVCSVTWERKKIPLRSLNINHILIKAKMRSETKDNRNSISNSRLNGFTQSSCHASRDWPNQIAHSYVWLIVPQLIVASPKCEGPRTLAKCRFIEHEAIGNDIDITMSHQRLSCR